LKYEKTYYFYCYPLESNPSISANIHILGALRQGGLDKEHPSIQKILTFLQATRIQDSFWFDKWQASPYYATSHAVIACTDYANELIEPAINWMIRTQDPSGGWGYYHILTAEETAYCLQALTIWNQYGGAIPKDIFERGKTWLLDHSEPPYPPLWIGKCLYSPETVVRSAILSALTVLS
jgi:halimadienyl-diphosphate synthase